MTKEKIDALGAELGEILKNDILGRYNNNEYWDDNVINAFFQDNKITFEDRRKVERSIKC